MPSVATKMGTGWQEIREKIHCHWKLVSLILFTVLFLEYLLLGCQARFVQLALCTVIIVPEAVLDSIYMRLYHRLSLTLGAVGICTSLLMYLLAATDAAADLASSSGEALLGIFMDAGAGALVFGGLMLMIFLLTRRLGFGDVCYGGALGIMLGADRALTGFFITFYLGLLYAAGMHISNLMRQEQVGKVVPLGPFMAAGSLISMIYGEELMAWYLHGG